MSHKLGKMIFNIQANAENFKDIKRKDLREINKA